MKPFRDAPPDLNFCAGTTFRTDPACLHRWEGPKTWSALKENIIVFWDKHHKQIEADAVSVFPPFYFVRSRIDSIECAIKLAWLNTNCTVFLGWFALVWNRFIKPKNNFKEKIGVRFMKVTVRCCIFFKILKHYRFCGRGQYCTILCFTN